MNHDLWKLGMLDPEPPFCSADEYQQAKLIEAALQRWLLDRDTPAELRDSLREALEECQAWVDAAECG